MNKKSEKIETLPGFPNAFPYNELLFDGKLMAKTRSWAWKHRGLVLLYTSTSTSRVTAKAYGLDSKKYPRCVIVGVGELTDVRKLTREEEDKLFCQFNNATPEEADEFGSFAGPSYVAPLEFGYFFKNLQRFKEPVPFKPPKGAVSVFRVPITVVKKALQEIGVRV